MSNYYLLVVLKVLFIDMIFQEIFLLQFYGDFLVILLQFSHQRLEATCGNAAFP